jgi:hypothetical protein
LIVLARSGIREAAPVVAIAAVVKRVVDEYCGTAFAVFVVVVVLVPLLVFFGLFVVAGAKVSEGSVRSAAYARTVYARFG